MRKLIDSIRHNAVALVALLLALGTFANAQGIIGVFQNGTSTVPAAYGVGDATSGLYWGTGFTGVIKHLVTSGGTLPTVASCGTGAVATGSTDTAGKVTATGATACTVSFGTAFTSAPWCVAVDITTVAGLKLAPVAATGFTISGLTSGDAFEYVCVGQAGG